MLHLNYIQAVSYSILANESRGNNAPSSRKKRKCGITHNETRQVALAFPFFFFLIIKRDINIRYRSCHIRYYSNTFSLGCNSSASVFAKATDEFSRRFEVTASLITAKSYFRKKKKKKDRKKEKEKRATAAVIDSVLDGVSGSVA